MALSTRDNGKMGPGMGRASKHGRQANNMRDNGRMINIMATESSYGKVGAFTKGILETEKSMATG